MLLRRHLLLCDGANDLTEQVLSGAEVVNQRIGAHPQAKRQRAKGEASQRALGEVVDDLDKQVRLALEVRWSGHTINITDVLL